MDRESEIMAWAAPRFNDVIFTQHRSGRKRRGSGLHTKRLRKDPCAYCGGPGGTVDHVVPKSSGGDGNNNLTGACYQCNGRKDSKDLLSFLLEIKEEI